jgi:hypothetical protein
VSANDAKDDKQLHKLFPASARISNQASDACQLNMIEHRLPQMMQMVNDPLR